MKSVSILDRMSQDSFSAGRESVFPLDELMEHAETLFGVGGHVLVGARSGGFLGPDPVSRPQVQRAVKEYLSSPVTREGS